MRDDGAVSLTGGARRGSHNVAQEGLGHALHRAGPTAVATFLWRGAGRATTTFTGFTLGESIYGNFTSSSESHFGKR